MGIELKALVKYSDPMDDFENIEQGEKSSIYENKRTYCGVEGTLQAVPAFRQSPSR